MKSEKKKSEKYKKKKPLTRLFFLVAGRGFFIALRRRIVVCRASIHSARHTPCFVRFRGAKRIFNPFCLLAPDLLRRSVGLYTTQQPTKKGHRLVSFPLVAGRGFEPPDLRVMRCSNDESLKIDTLYRIYVFALSPSKTPS